MKLRTLIALIVLGVIAGSCIKTKTCNLSISNTEKEWFVYDSSDQRLYSNEANQKVRLAFSKIYTHADDEVLEGNTCRADAVSYINIIDSLGNESTIGQYLLLKSGSSNSTQSLISLGDLEFFQNNYTDSNLRLSRSGNFLKRLDSLTVNDSVFENVLTIPDQDTSNYTYNQFQNIWFSKNFEILKFKIRQSESAFELEFPSGE